MSPFAQRVTWIAAGLSLLVALWGLSFYYFDFRTTVQWTEVARTISTDHPLFIAGILLGLQAASMLLSLPTKALINIAAGALLGFASGVGLTLLGVLLGTSVLFFAVRRGNRSRLSFKPHESFANLTERLARNPVLSVAALRLMVLLPYGPITIGCALTPVSYRHFLIGSLLGDIPVVMLYTLAGARLMTLSSTADAIPTSTIIILMSAGILLLAGLLIPSKAILRGARSESES